MKRFIIEIEAGGGFDVVDDSGRRCNGMTWDEMLGQVAQLTLAAGRARVYPMKTPAEWAEDAASRTQRINAYK